jgi:hypothetical protein
MGGKTDGVYSGWLLKRMAVILQRMAGTTDGGHNVFFITGIVYSGWAHTTDGGYSGFWLLRSLLLYICIYMCVLPLFITVLATGT